MRGTIRDMHRLLRDASGAAMTEFVLAMPLLMTAGLFGTELANFALVQMKVHETAIHLADNASRVGDTSNLQNRKIYEADINDLFLGSSIQASASLNFYEHGRAIVSSLETRPANPSQQYIHWQRCKGKKTWASTYGNEGTDVSGMGPTGEQVIAQSGEAVIFVEVVYDYQPLISSRFIGSTTIKSIASFTVRDKRDLSQIYQRNPSSPDAISACNVYSGFTTVTV
ncbi:MAG: TadE/TadG family type IV pilus assembly protein [Novosphingobium sp.]